MKIFLAQEAAMGGSEDMLHFPVDLLIRLPLTFISERVTNLSTAIDRNRPDE